MREFFLSLRIRVKLLLAFGSILLMSVLLIIFTINSIDIIIRYKAINEEVDVLMRQMETLELTSKDFMYEGYKLPSFLIDQKSPSIATFEESYSLATNIIRDINYSTITEEYGTENLTNTLTDGLDSLKQNFTEIVRLLQKRGFRDHGLEGSLRAAIHKVENSGLAFDKTSMLMLRRHEKDFFLRKDIKYQDEFNSLLDTFIATLDTNSGTVLASYLSDYRTEFNNIVEIEKEIGLKQDEGIRGRINSYFKRIRPKLNDFSSRVKEGNEAQISNSKATLLTIFVVQMIAGISLALLYAHLLTSAIKEIRTAMQKLASGVFPEKLLVKTTEEIGQTKTSFNQFVDRLKTATVFAEQLGNTSHLVEYDGQYAGDVLAKSLIAAQRKLSDADERQSKINWMNEGAAKFNDMLKGESDDMGKFGDTLLTLIIHHLNANQGALYLRVKKGDEDLLQRVATYAYGKKRFDEGSIDVGSGISGQVVLEASTLYLADIPRDYVRITSGLGGATPRNLVIVPLKIQQKVMGVIELASFSKLEPYHIEFVEKIAENVATILLSKQSARETMHLLEESQRRSNILAQQEEEMRQNAEELQATQEEMERQRSAMQEEIRLLKIELRNKTAMV